MLSKILIALLLGLYTSFGLHYYSHWMSRTKNGILRLLLFVLSFSLFVAVPLLECTGTVGHLSKQGNGNLIVILTMSWLSVVLMFLVLNWRTFDQRLRGPSGLESAGATVGE